MDVSAQLKEWTQIFLKSRDVLQKSITGFESLNGDFVVHKSSGDVIFLIRPEFSNADIHEFYPAYCAHINHIMCAQFICQCATVNTRVQSCLLAV